MSRVSRFLSYMLLAGLPLVVLFTSVNTEDLRLVFLPEQFFLYLRLIYLPAKYFFWGLIVAALCCFLLLERRRFQWKAPHVAMVLLWAWMLASFQWSINIHQTLESFTQWSLIFGTAFLFSFFLTDRKHMKVALWCCVASVAIAALLSMVEQYTHLVGIYQGLGFRNASTFGNYKFISHFSIICLPFFIALFSWSTSVKERFFLFLTLSILGVHFAIIGFGAKAVWLGLALNVFALFLYAIRCIPHYKKVLTLAILSLVVTASYVGYQSYQQISPKNASSSVQQRWVMWGNTWQAIKEKPLLGAGLGTFPVIYSKYEDPNDRDLYPTDTSKGWVYFTRQAHNDILQMVAEVGVVGFVLFLLLVGLLLVQGLAVLRYGSDDKRRLAGVLLLSLLNLLVLAAVYFPFHQPMSALLFSFVGGTLMGLSRRSQEDEGTAPFFLQSPVMTVGVLVFLPFMVFTTLKYFLSDWHWNQAHFQATTIEEINTQVDKALSWNENDWEKLWSVGLFYLRREEFEKARDFFKRSTELNPYMPHLRYNLGLAHANLGEPAQALTNYNKALKIAPDYTLAYHQMGQMFFERADLKKALKFFRRAQQHPHYMFERSFYMAALCEARLKRYALAKKEILEAVSMNPYDLHYHRVLTAIEQRQKKAWTPFKKAFPLQQLERQLRSGKAITITKALRQAQHTLNAEQLLSTVFGLLRHENRRVRMEATQYFLSLPDTAVIPILKMYSMLKDDEMKWRVFHIISEKIPEKAVSEAKRIFHDESVTSVPLKVMSVRLLSKLSPYDLVLPTTTGTPEYEIIRFYTMN